MEVIRITTPDQSPEYNSCVDLAALIGYLEKKTADEGRVICHIEVNGMTMSEQDESAFGNTPLAGVRELVVQTENVAALVQASIGSVREWIERLKEACVTTAEDFRRAQGTEEQKKFANLMDGYRELIQTLGVLKAHIEPASNNGEFKSQWQTCEMHTNNAVIELYEAYENSDRVLISDILEYELYSCLDRWLGLIKV